MENKNTWKLQFKANVIASFKQLEKMHLSPDKEQEKLHDFVMYSRNQIPIKSTLRADFTELSLLMALFLSTHTLCVVSALLYTFKISAKSNLHVAIISGIRAIFLEDAAD